MAPSPPPLFHLGPEGPLDQWVQTAGGLVQDVQPGPVLHGADDGHLFPVAQAQLPDLLPGVQLQGPAELGGLGPAVLLPQVR